MTANRSASITASVTAITGFFTRLPLVIRWTLATALALTVGELLLPGEVYLSVLTIVLLSVLQSLVLRRYFKENALYWMIGSLLGWIAFNIISRLDFVAATFTRLYIDIGADGDVPLTLMLLGALLGLCVGIFQGVMLLRERIGGAGWWVVASVVGFTASTLLNILLARLYPGRQSADLGFILAVFANLALGGLLLGLITGFVLQALLRGSHRLDKI